MRSSIAILSLLAFLGGCAGYASDYWRPKENLIAPDLLRYGLSSGAAQCVGGRLKENLSVWQLRQLADLARRLVAGGQNPASLGPSALLYVAGLVRDPKVGTQTRRAFEACHVEPLESPAPAPPPVAAEPRPSAVTASPPPSAPTTPGGPLWVNLGSAATGQAISVDAASLENAPGWRRGWFRLANPGEAGPGALSYRLRIDCAARTITATAGRKYGPTGAMVEQKDYPTPQGPLPVEAGTVMEVAFKALCG
jgi:hypothetical protein